MQMIPAVCTANFPMSAAQVPPPSLNCNAERQIERDQLHISTKQQLVGYNNW